MQCVEFFSMTFIHCRRLTLNWKLVSRYSTWIRSIGRLKYLLMNAPSYLQACISCFIVPNLIHYWQRVCGMPYNCVFAPSSANRHTKWFPENEKMRIAGLFRFWKIDYTNNTINVMSLMQIEHSPEWFPGRKTLTFRATVFARASNAHCSVLMFANENEMNKYSVRNVRNYSNVHVSLLVQSTKGVSRVFSTSNRTREKTFVWRRIQRKKHTRKYNIFFFGGVRWKRTSESYIKHTLAVAYMLHRHSAPTIRAQWEWVREEVFAIYLGTFVVAAFDRQDCFSDTTCATYDMRDTVRSEAQATESMSTRSEHNILDFPYKLPHNRII